MNPKHINPTHASISRGVTRRAQSGITLIVCLILLTVLSATAAMSIKGSTSSEQIANNTRSQLLAFQLAEAALRLTEKGTVNYDLTQHGGTATTNYVNITIEAAPAVGVTPTWAVASNWDGSGPTSTEVPLWKLDDYAATSGSTVNRTENKFAATYKRNPDCMAQYMAAGSRSYQVVCRGFGPEVSSTRSAPPQGAEVFLQSTILN